MLTVGYGDIVPVNTLVILRVITLNESLLHAPFS